MENLATSKTPPWLKSPSGQEVSSILLANLFSMIVTLWWKCETSLSFGENMCWCKILKLNDVVAYGNWMLHTHILPNFLTELNKLLCELPWQRYCPAPELSCNPVRHVANHCINQYPYHKKVTKRSRQTSTPRCKPSFVDSAYQSHHNAWEELIHCLYF